MSLSKFIDSKIQRCIENGELDNLKGEGKPIDLEPGVNSEYWMANKILKNAGFVPEWIDLKKEIQKEMEELDEKLEDYQEYLKNLSERSDKTKGMKNIVNVYKRYKGEYFQAIEDLNTKIKKYNTVVPIISLQKYYLDVEKWQGKFEVVEKVYLKIINME